MKLKVTTELFELDGAPLTDDQRICPTCQRPVGDGKPLTIRRACVRALQFIPQQTKVSFEIQMKRYNLAQRFYEDDTVELTNKEAGMIQDLLAMLFMPTITGPVGEALEGKGSMDGD